MFNQSFAAFVILIIPFNSKDFFSITENIFEMSPLTFDVSWGNYIVIVSMVSKYGPWQSKPSLQLGAYILCDHISHTEFLVCFLFNFGSIS